MPAADGFPPSRGSGTYVWRPISRCSRPQRTHVITTGMAGDVESGLYVVLSVAAHPVPSYWWDVRPAGARSGPHRPGSAWSACSGHCRGHNATQVQKGGPPHRSDPPARTGGRGGHPALRVKAIGVPSWSAPPRPAPPARPGRPGRDRCRPNRLEPNSEAAPPKSVRHWVMTCRAREGWSWPQTVRGGPVRSCSGSSSGGLRHAGRPHGFLGAHPKGGVAARGE